MKNILMLVSLSLLLFSCSSDNDGLDIEGTLAPRVTYSFDVLTADLNKLDNLPITGVVASELGLESVDMYLLNDGKEEHLKTETKFFNKKSYSFAETLTFQNTYEGFVIEAKDLAGRVTKETLAFDLIEVKDAPVIVFDPQKIEYDETNPTPMPNTTFRITSTAGLKTIEMSLMTVNGATLYAELSPSGSPLDFEFDEPIVYNEESKGFRVKVTDVYDQVTYGTMVVDYKSVPPPVLEIEQSYVHSLNANGITLPMKITSHAGVKTLEIFKVEDGVEASVLLTNYNGENDLEINPQFDLTNKTTELKIVVTDRTLAQRTDTRTLRAIIGLSFVERAISGSQVYASGLTGANVTPNVYSLFSLKDMTTYSVDNVLSGAQSEKNVDFKFYLFGGKAVPRIYSVDGGNGTKSNEYKGKLGSVSDFVNPTQTRFLLLNGFDFDGATVDNIKAGVIPSLLKANQINELKSNDVIAFRTTNSTSGEDKIGVIKIVNIRSTNPGNAVQGEFVISVKMIP